MAADSFVRWYWNLNVQARHPSAGWVNLSISCNKYLMNVRSDAVDAKQQHIRQLMATAQSRGVRVSGGAFSRVVVGKGHPEDMEHVLSAGVTSGVLAGTQAGVQQWADDNLGVDCTGFASNYFLNVVRPTGVQVTNIGCGYFRSQSISYNGRTGAFIWEFDQVRPDDVILWMQEGGVETKHPGHISLIYDTTQESGTNILLCGESSGAAETGDPIHSGPKLSRHTWADPVGSQANRRLNMGQGVIIVRPFPYNQSGSGDGSSAVA